VHNRILGGVAAGLADYLDIDVVIVRIAFVALTLLGGSGLLLYLAGWLLIPAQESGRAVVQDFMERRPRRRSLVAIVLGTVIGIVALSNLFSSGPWWPHWDGGLGGFGFFLGLCALALAVVLVVSSGRRAGSPLRWALLTTFIAVVAVVVVAVATVFSVEALSGVPLRGGVGDMQWRPTAASQVAPRYRLAIGNMQVDLSNVTFRPGTTHVTASVGIGNLVVDLPSGTAVSVSAHSGLGDVQVFGQNDGGFGPRRVMQSAGSTTSVTVGTGPRIVLDAQTGVGHVQVIRIGP
jgi:phage shock protein PspC (stress-responsive transcriptional regulator)